MSVLAEPAATVREAPPERKPRVRTPATGTFAISAATLVALLLGWVIATRYHLASPLFLPSPGDVLV